MIKQIKRLCCQPVHWCIYLILPGILSCIESLLCDKSLLCGEVLFNSLLCGSLLCLELLACKFFFLDPIQAFGGAEVIPIILYKGKHGREMGDIVLDEETILFIGQLPFEFDGNMETDNSLELEQSELAILLHCNGETFKIGNGKFLEVI